MNSPILFPLKGTLTDAGDGDGGKGKKTQKITPTPFFPIFSPRKGTLTAAGDGEGGEQKIPKISPKPEEEQKTNIYIIYTLKYILYYI